MTRPGRPSPAFLTLVGLLALPWAGCLPRRAGGVVQQTGPLSEIERLFAERKYGEVVQALDSERIRGLPRRARPRAYDLLGLSLQDMGDVSRALQVFQLAEGIYPKDLNILTDLASLLHSSGLHERARPYYERVLRIHPNNARSHLGLAEIHRSQGFLARSEEHYEHCLREWNMHAFIWRDYARVLAAERKLDRAADAARRALALQREPDTLLLLATVERGQGLKDAAYAGLAEAAGLAPERLDLTLEKALWLLEDGRLDEAKAAASAALRTSPDEPLAHWVKASVALRRGFPTEAKMELASAASQEGTFVSRAARAMLEALP